MACILASCCPCLFKSAPVSPQASTTPRDPLLEEKKEEYGATAKTASAAAAAFREAEASPNPPDLVTVDPSSSLRDEDVVSVAYKTLNPDEQQAVIKALSIKPSEELATGLSANSEFSDMVKGASRPLVAMLMPLHEAAWSKIRHETKEGGSLTSLSPVQKVISFCSKMNRSSPSLLARDDALRIAFISLPDSSQSEVLEALPKKIRAFEKRLKRQTQEVSAPAATQEVAVGCSSKACKARGSDQPQTRAHDPHSWIQDRINEITRCQTMLQGLAEHTKFAAYAWSVIDTKSTDSDETATKVNKLLSYIRASTTED